MLQRLLTRYDATNMFPVTWHSHSQSKDWMFNIQLCGCGNWDQWDGVVGGANQGHIMEIEIKWSTKCLVAHPLANNKLERCSKLCTFRVCPFFNARAGTINLNLNVQGIRCQPLQVYAKNCCAAWFYKPVFVIILF